MYDDVKGRVQVSVGMNNQCCSMLPFKGWTGNDNSGHYFCPYFFGARAPLSILYP